MGERVDFADLADDDLYDPDEEASTAPAAPDTDSDAQPSSESVQPAIARHDGSGRPRTVPTTTIALNPLNKRPAGDDDEIEQMAATIGSRGVIQPLVVCSVTVYLAEFPDQRDFLDAAAEWVVLIGNRRLRAAREAALGEVPIIVNDENVQTMFEVMLIENGHRRDLPPLYEAEAMAEVLVRTSISQRQLARRIGKSHPYITQRLALLKLIPELRTALNEGELKIELAREFGELTEDEQREIAAAGKPYRRRPAGGNAVTTPPARRTIRATTPAHAAESIRERFSDEELAELIRLLTQPARKNTSSQS